MNKALDAIKNTLDKLSALVAQQQMERHAALSKQGFKSALPGLKAALEFARQEKIKTPPNVIDDLQKRLLETSKDAPEFWQTSSALLNYRSFDVDPQRAAELLGANIPNCTDSDPAPFTITEVNHGFGSGPVTGVSSPYYENCRFTLDSAKDDARINSMIADGFPVIEFRHCVIVYNGGSFTLITNINRQNVPATGGHGTGLTLNFNGPTLWFTQCLFEFSVSDHTPEPAKKLTQSLLAQNGPSLAIPVLKPSPTSAPTHN